MRTILLLTACLAMGGGLAEAQHRVGSEGHALDANMGAGSGGVNRVEGRVDYSARNNVITGNVTDFSQFRGTINYSAAGEFSDSLGSNNLFRFQANSYGSGLGNTNTSLDPTRAQGMTTGVARPYSAPQGAGTSARVSYQVVPEGASYRVYGPTNGPGAGVRLEDAALSGNDAALARFRGMNGESLMINASPLTGVRRLTEGEPARPRAVEPEEDTGLRRPSFLNSLDSVPAGTDAGASLSEAPSYGSPNLVGSSMLVGRGVSGAYDGRVSAQSQPLSEVVKKVESELLSQKTVRQYAPGEDVYADVVRRLAGPEPDKTQLLQRNEMLYPNESMLPEELRGAVDSPGINRVEAAENAFNVSRGLMDDQLFGLVPEGDGEGEAGSEAGSETGSDSGSGDPGLDELERFVSKIAVPTQRLDTLVSERRDRFEGLMSSAEDQLRSGDFFVAERTYRRALTQNPGHPMARIGLVHAQMSAGMIRSAAANLRGLFNDHPELLTVRYGAGVLPPADRVNWIQAELQRSIAAGGDQRRSGFLLGYLGYQLESRQLVRYGLAVAGAADPEDSLIPLLQRVWLPEQAPSDAPTIGVE